MPPVAQSKAKSIPKGTAPDASQPISQSGTPSGSVAGSTKSQGMLTRLQRARHGYTPISDKNNWKPVSKPTDGIDSKEITQRNLEDMTTTLGGTHPHQLSYQSGYMAQTQTANNNSSSQITSVETEPLTPPRLSRGVGDSKDSSGRGLTDAAKSAIISHIEKTARKGLKSPTHQASPKPSEEPQTNQADKSEAEPIRDEPNVTNAVIESAPTSTMVQPTTAITTLVTEDNSQVEDVEPMRDEKHAETQDRVSDNGKPDAINVSKPTAVNRILIDHYPIDTERKTQFHDAGRLRVQTDTASLCSMAENMHDFVSPNASDMHNQHERYDDTRMSRSPSRHNEYRDDAKAPERYEANPDDISVELEHNPDRDEQDYEESITTDYIGKEPPRKKFCAKDSAGEPILTQVRMTSMRERHIKEVLNRTQLGPNVDATHPQTQQKLNLKPRYQCDAIRPSNYNSDPKEPAATLRHLTETAETGDIIYDTFEMIDPRTDQTVEFRKPFFVAPERIITSSGRDLHTRGVVYYLDKVDENFDVEIDYATMVKVASVLIEVSSVRASDFMTTSILIYYDVAGRIVRII